MMNNDNELQLILPINPKYKKNIYTKLDAGNMFLLTILAPQFLGAFFLVGLMTFTFFVPVMDYEALMDNIFVKVLLTLIAQLAFVLVFFIYNHFTKTNIIRANKINFNFKFWTIPLAIVMGLIALFGFNPLITSFDYLISLTGHVASTLPIPLNTIGWLFVNIVMLAVLPAIIEELLFRGVILNGLKQYGKIKAIIFSSLLFALVHGSIDQTLYPILFGLVLGLLATKTNSVMPGIIIHFVNNCTVLVISYINEITNSAQTVLVDWKYTLIAIGIAVLSAGVIFGLSFLLKPKKQEVQIFDVTETEINNIEHSRKLSNVSLWVGIGIGIFLWIFGTLA